MISVPKKKTWLLNISSYHTRCIRKQLLKSKSTAYCGHLEIGRNKHSCYSSKKLVKSRPEGVCLKITNSLFKKISNTWAV